MIVQKYLCVTNKGTCRLTQTTPNLSAREIAVKLSIEIPNSFFERPSLSATIKLPDALLGSSQVTATVAGDIEKLVRETTGMDISVQLVEVNPPNPLEALYSDKTE